MLNWLFKRLFTPERLGYVIELARPRIQEIITEEAENTLFNLLESKDVAEGITTYGDALFERYKRKAWGAIGGLQQGLNKDIREEAQGQIMQNLTGDLPNILDSEGNISMSNIIKTFLPRILKGGGAKMLGGTQTGQNLGGRAPDAT